MGLKRRDPAKVVVTSAQDWNDKGDMMDYPNLYAFLHDRTFEDKTPRQPGSISIFCRNGELSCSINDKEQSLVAYCNAPTLAELVTTIEMTLSDDNTDWKTQKAYGKTPPF